MVYRKSLYFLNKCAQGSRGNVYDNINKNKSYSKTNYLINTRYHKLAKLRNKYVLS